MGLVNRVLPPDELLEGTLDFARTMAREIAPSSLRVLKAQLWADQLDPLETSIQRAEALLGTMIGAPEFNEGVAALTERRPPRF
jgi:enoyl-CoA hydratase/carnithine racemase